MAVLMPISSCASTKAPPESARVDRGIGPMKPDGKDIGHDVRPEQFDVLALADTMPAVTVLVRSKGWPTASTQSPDVVIAVSPRQSSESVGVNAQDGDVRGRIAPDQFSGERAVVVEPDFDGIRPSLDDVVVGDDEAVRRQDDLTPDLLWTRDWAGGF